MCVTCLGRTFAQGEERLGARRIVLVAIPYQFALLGRDLVLFPRAVCSDIHGFVGWLIALCGL